MPYYCEDFYHEPSEFDLRIDEFKESLMKSVKEDFIAELEELKKENESLQDVKKNFESIKRDYENKERELEIERNNAKREVRRELISDILDEYRLIMYQASQVGVEKPKCDKCDKNRRINYKTPLGKDATEYCDCSTKEYTYKPKKHALVELSPRNNFYDLSAFYYEVRNSGGKDEYLRLSDYSQHATYIYRDGMGYKDIKRYSTFFKTKEECQKYCDWLNENKV